MVGAVFCERLMAKKSKKRNTKKINFEICSSSGCDRAPQPLSAITAPVRLAAAVWATRLEVRKERQCFSYECDGTTTLSGIKNTHQSGPFGRVD